MVYSEHYPLPLAEANGQNGDPETRPHRSFYQGENLVSGGIVLVVRK
jgi:hypothetical protein